MSAALQAWLESGRHLPAFMRDFHDQKDLFKWLGEVMQESRKRSESAVDNFAGLNNWINTHVYAIDVFPWCLAKRGWTLQRARPPKGVEFADIGDTLAAANRDRLERERAVIEALAAGQKGPEGESPK